MLLEISQNSQENTYARDSFLIKLQASSCNFIKKESLALVFSCEFCEICKNTFFLQNTSGGCFSKTAHKLFFFFKKTLAYVPLGHRDLKKAFADASKY